MNLLFIRPDPGNERFGLGPFFRVEPLGMEYIAAALRPLGVNVTVVDERFRPGLTTWIRRTRPQAVGIACIHALEYDRVLEVARLVRREVPEAFIFVGGHAAAAFPAPLEAVPVDAIVLDDGEDLVPALVRALQRKAPLTEVPALRIPTRQDGWVNTPPIHDRTGLDDVALPDRTVVERYRDRYHCLLFKPVWLIETARGCPFRCNFCSVWQLYGRSFRERSIGAVVEDFRACGPHVFVVDDLFWNHPARSLELAQALKKAGIRKRWMLVQSRTDLVSRNPDLLAAWREIAQDFDIFFGLEAASDQGLKHITKDATVNQTLRAAEVARSYRYGVTGNFLVDPEWGDHEFHELWDFVQTHGFQRAGYTILTPLPGTELFEQLSGALKDQPWFKYDMHHVLFEPRLGAQRFFELYAETWRRSILNLGGQKKWTDWVRQVKPSHIPYITRIMLRTQRMMDPKAYLAEHQAGVAAKSILSFEETEAIRT